MSHGLIAPLHRFLPGIALAWVLAACCNQALGQVPDAASADTGGFRKLAPGVERTIDPESQTEETFSYHDLVGLLKLDSQFGVRPWSPANLAKNVRLEHQIWGLTLTFKPIRYITLEIPNASGVLERKLVWYMVYHVKNTSPKPVRFVPRFLLHSHDVDQYYEDRIIPMAAGPIQRREDPRRKLLNNVEISDAPIPPSAEGEDNSIYGVTTWVDVDPRTDSFSVYVQGLTNAYRIVEDKEGLSWKFQRKTLQLNFWRPSDEFFENEQEIRLGLPGDVDYRWVYK